MICEKFVAKKEMMEHDVLGAKKEVKISAPLRQV